jgi:hypothetical protein
VSAAATVNDDDRDDGDNGAGAPRSRRCHDDVRDPHRARDRQAAADGLQGHRPAAPEVADRAGRRPAQTPRALRRRPRRRPCREGIVGPELHRPAPLPVPRRRRGGGRGRVQRLGRARLSGVRRSRAVRRAALRGDGLPHHPASRDCPGDRRHDRTPDRPVGEPDIRQDRDPGKGDARRARARGCRSPGTSASESAGRRRGTGRASGTSTRGKTAEGE